MDNNEQLYNRERLRYLKLLAESFPTINSAGTEVINLKAILNLPKGTEHFVSDIHGEFDSFNHVLKNASGVIRSYIDDIFGTSLRENEKRSLATLIYYPEEKIKIAEKNESDMTDWYRITLYRLIQVCRKFSSKYTRSKVRKAMQQDFAYIMDELLNENDELKNKKFYYSGIIDTIIDLGRSADFIVAISRVIQRLAIDRLHIIGDIYDRGPDADKIVDKLRDYHSVDIQWGNHDIVWMGAAAGSRSCICNVIRICARYNNLHIIEESYGINLVPLASYAMEHYKNDDCALFMPDKNSTRGVSEKEVRLVAMMHKAIVMLQFKEEAALIKRNPNFQMDDRILLDKINFETGKIRIGEDDYDMLDMNFPTVDPENPLALSELEYNLLEKLEKSFMNSQKLQDHTRFLFNKGNMYLIFNSNLLFHGCIPLNGDGTLKKVLVDGAEYSGKEYLDKLEQQIREGFFSPVGSAKRQAGLDLMWYMWCGADSPLFGKDRMTTFERHFIADKKTHTESKDPYYDLRNDENICLMILADFGIPPEKSHIINGHVPVKAGDGESPVMANGRLLVIDGGFAKAYQKVTGIAGYTLVYNSYGLLLSAHEPFESAQDAIINEKDIVSQRMLVELNQNRITVEATDIGRDIKEKVANLEELLYAYRKGWVVEKEKYDK